MSDPRAVLDSLARLLASRPDSGSAAPLPAFSDAAALFAAAAPGAAAPPPPSAASEAPAAALSLASGMTLTPLPPDRLQTAAAFSGVLRGDAPEDAPARASGARARTPYSATLTRARQHGVAPLPPPPRLQDAQHAPALY